MIYRNLSYSHKHSSSKKKMCQGYQHLNQTRKTARPNYILTGHVIFLFPPTPPEKQNFVQNQVTGRSSKYGMWLVLVHAATW